MSGYVRETPFNGTFEGKAVTAKLAPLSFRDSIRLQGTEVKDDADAACVLAEIIPRYVQGLDGVTDSDGEPIAIEEICASAYFALLILDIGRALLNASKPTDPKRPSVPSAA